MRTITPRRLLRAAGDCVGALLDNEELSSASRAEGDGSWLVLVAVGPARVAEISAALERLPGAEAEILRVYQDRIAELEAQLAAVTGSAVYQ